MPCWCNMCAKWLVLAVSSRLLTGGVDWLQKNESFPVKSPMVFVVYAGAIQIHHLGCLNQTCHRWFRRQTSHTHYVGYVSKPVRLAPCIPERVAVTPHGSRGGLCGASCPSNAGPLHPSHFAQGAAGSNMSTLSEPRAIHATKLGRPRRETKEFNIQVTKALSPC